MLVFKQLLTILKLYQVTTLQYVDKNFELKKFVVSCTKIDSDDVNFCDQVIKSISCQSVSPSAHFSFCQKVFICLPVCESEVLFPLPLSLSPFVFLRVVFVTLSNYHGCLYHSLHLSFCLRVCPSIFLLAVFGIACICVLSIWLSSSLSLSLLYFRLSETFSLSLFVLSNCRSACLSLSSFHLPLF